MNRKTEVRLKGNVTMSNLKKGDIGYIDGYVRASDDRPYAIVISGSDIDMVPLYQLEVIEVGL